MDSSTSQSPKSSAKIARDILDFKLPEEGGYPIDFKTFVRESADKCRRKFQYATTGEWPEGARKLLSGKKFHIGMIGITSASYKRLIKVLTSLSKGEELEQADRKLLTMTPALMELLIEMSDFQSMRDLYAKESNQIFFDFTKECGGGKTKYAFSAIKRKHLRDDIMPLFEELAANLNIKFAVPQQTR